VDAVSLLNKHIDVARILDHYDFEILSHDGDFARGRCKIHDGNNKTAFVINITNGLWFCHSGGCGGGDVYTMVQKLEESSFMKAVQRVASILGVDIENLQIIERKEKYLDELRQWIKMMKKRREKTTFEAYVVKEEVIPVAKFRDFKQETLDHFQLGYVESIELSKRNGDMYTLKNRLVMPICFNDMQVGVSLRKTKSRDVPKWSHQPVNINTGNILYNFDNVKNRESIVVSEGITDVWAWYEINVDACCTLGAHLTDEQYKLLMKTGADLIFAYDGDEAGREATRKARAMLRNKVNMEYVVFDEGEDPESISREELKLKYEQRRRI
jgi:DNA primase